ncbi:PAQR family membrane homeostasis protein TrhA [Roseiterribacter gracilis]|uniref:PAQR family membrane homeostasis protein TrhA n=1 Tax=Roseiterribacter gracilis TaxID=2812848 RepID=UPI003B42F3B0
MNLQAQSRVTTRRPTEREERANAWTHGIGALLSLLAAVSLIVLPPVRASSVTIASCIAFCIAALITMGASTAHHASVCERKKRLFLAFDHAAIGILIAGSWTAFAAVSLPARDLPPLLAGLWSAASIIAIEQFVCLSRGCEPWLEQYSAALFLAMGWIPVAIYGDKVLAGLPYDSAVLLSAGCLSYTTGVVAYVARRVPFHHAVWHVLVVAGATLHFFALRAALA